MAEAVMMVAPTEPVALKELGVVMSIPEKYGVDFLWPVDGGLAGMQRKEFGDLVSSVRDGRLQRELGQMQGLTWRGLVIEGSGPWTGEGEWMAGYGGAGRFNQDQLWGIVASVQGMGVTVQQVADLNETKRCLRRMMAWTRKGGGGGSLLVRPGPKGNAWGSKGNKDFQIHLLTSLPGIGQVLAERILERFGGVPWQWSASREELMEVPGMGKAKVERVMKVMGEARKEEEGKGER